ncbi:PstS family phosphate ABC transporter substrate-binding protein [Candidatus Magnetominusculus xianensis]|uniref:Phosphate-binding protein n=1 Tax=Candidatus Magnetominusculus xianensis TaxID=1748249 RepID=A0ABR5SH31_9BACT|nr:PstS family phosphate ABC transporter substrate-binding protein [Candidatus Magnetominusculus xianensis]KWT90972.1 phosphate ABC transporter substrate-binding protein [Candidatus Magnetominusculus xianensis]MBF0403126.1 PstS family phosphate ABC transporter substrate-binding protein [Nitrospirota bacterium]
MKGLQALLLMCIMLFSVYAQAEESLRIDGSTTVLPIAQKAAEEFNKKNPNIKVSVTGSGSGNGIKALMDGTTDVATSSREAKEKEVAAAKSKGIEMTPFIVAYDGIVPVVHPSMKIDKITMEQLRDIYNGKINSWKDIGGPARPITVVSRDTSSGTYEVWEEKVMKKDLVRADALLVASNGQAVQTVAQNPFALGYVGIGYMDKSVKPLLVNDVKDSPETVRNGRWPIARGLYMYTKGKPAGNIAKFIDFVMSKEGQDIVNAVKFVSLK